MYLKSFVTANGQLFNLHKFVLFSRIKAKNGSFAKKEPYKGRNQRIYCVPFWFGPKFKIREYLYDSASPKCVIYSATY